LINPDFVYDDDYKQITEKIFLNYNAKSKKDIEKINKYVVIFYKKIEEYLAKNNNVVFGDIVTKLIRAKVDNFNPKLEMIVDKFSLQNCKLDDLLVDDLLI